MKPRPAQPPDDLAPLAKAAAGLLYPSESDNPFTPFLWPATPGQTAREAVAAQAGATAASAVEQTLDEFFCELESSPHDRPRFAALHRALTARLADVRVFRAGTRKVDVYLIGRSGTGAWAGLHTVSIET